MRQVFLKKLGGFYESGLGDVAKCNNFQLSTGAPNTLYETLMFFFLIWVFKMSVSLWHFFKRPSPRLHQIWPRRVRENAFTVNPVWHLNYLRRQLIPRSKNNPKTNQNRFQTERQKNGRIESRGKLKKKNVFQALIQKEKK